MATRTPLKDGFTKETKYKIFNATKPKEEGNPAIYMGEELAYPGGPIRHRFKRFSNGGILYVDPTNSNYGNFGYFIGKETNRGVGVNPGALNTLNALSAPIGKPNVAIINLDFSIWTRFTF